MKERFLSLALAIVLTMSLLPVQVFAAGDDSVEIAMEPETMELGPIETSAQTLSLMTLDDSGQVALKAGNYESWIDRLDLTGAECLDEGGAVVNYAEMFYDWLEDSSVEGGDLMSKDAEEYTAASFTGKATFAYTEGDDAANQAAASAAFSSQYQANFSEAAAYIAAAYYAFDRDHPEVFWLSDDCKITTTGSYTYSSDGTVTFEQYIVFVLRDTEGFDIHAAEYESSDTLTAAYAAAQANLESVLSGMEADASTYEKVLTIHNYLTGANCYNSSSDLSTIDHECCEFVSALGGRTGEKGPVCEGYARAFKVMCDKLNIPCVLVDGNATNSSGSTEAHMWNYVQLDDEAWYAVDVTWDDPAVSGVSAAVSGSENQSYFLVGSETDINGMKFIESHPVSNTPSSTGPSFINGPVLNAAAYTTGNDGDVETEEPDAGVITEVASGTCGAAGNEENVKWSLDNDGTLTISGTGATWDNCSFPDTIRAQIAKVVVEDGITAIGKGTFAQLSNLTEVSIADSVITIGDEAFYYCEKLTAVALGSGVESIGTMAFYHCASLTSMTLPASLTGLGSQVFGYGGITELTFTGTTPPTAASTTESPFVYMAGGTIWVPTGENGAVHGDYVDAFCTEFMPDNVRLLPTGVESDFYIINNKLEAYVGKGGDVTIPDGVTSIGQAAFQNCSGLTSVTFPDGLSMIGTFVFDNCDNLKRVTFPNDLTLIGSHAFADCSGLTEVAFTGSAPALSIFENAFVGVTATVTYPGDDTTWTDFQKQNYGGTLTWRATCGDELSWTIGEKGELIISGTGAMFDYQLTEEGYAHNTPWAFHYPSVLCVENGVTTIGDYAFYNSIFLNSVNLPDTLTSIGSYAFGECTELKEITIPASVKVIGDYAFKGCTALTTVYGESGSYAETWAVENGYTFVSNTVVEPDAPVSVVAQIGETAYTTLQAAIDAAQSGDTVKLLTNVVLDTAVTFDKRMTLDLNGKAITVSDTFSGYSALYFAGDVTVKGGTIGNPDSTAGNTNYTLFVSGGTLTLEDGNYYSNGTVLWVTQGDVYVQGGTFLSHEEDKRYLLNCNDTNYASGAAAIHVSGGTFHGFDPANSYSEHEDTAVSFVANGHTSVDNEDGTWAVKPQVTVTVEDAIMLVGGEMPEFTYDCTASDLYTVNVDVVAPTVTGVGTYKLTANVTVDERKDAIIQVTPGILTVVEPVAQVGEDKFATVQEAIDAANGGTVTLIADVVQDGGLDVYYCGAITLDLNGHTLQTGNVIANYEPLTIIDSGTEKGAIINAGSSYAIQNIGGTLVLNGVTIQSKSDWTAVFVDEGTAEFTDTVISGAGAIGAQAATVTVNSGTYQIGVQSTNKMDSVLSASGSTVTIKGGTFDGTGAANTSVAVQASLESVVTIEGGTFHGKDYALYAVGSGTINAHAGTFQSDREDKVSLAISSTDATVAVYGGTYYFDPAAFAAFGFSSVANEDGTWTVEVVEALEYWPVTGTDGKLISLRHTAAVEVYAADPDKVSKVEVLWGKTVLSSKTAENAYALKHSFDWDVRELSGSQTLTYRITDGEGNVTEKTATVNVLAYAVPVKPTVTATAGFKSVALNWEGYEESADLTTLKQFKVYSCDVDGGNKSLLTNIKNYKYTRSGLTEIAYFIVAAEDIYGAVTYSNVISATPLLTESVAPTASILIQNLVPTTGQDITFSGTNSHDNDSIESYAWNFGDNSTASGSTATHAYAEAGTYTVTLTVTDPSGNTGTESKTITILDTTSADAEHARLTVNIIDGYSEGTPAVKGATVTVTNTDGFESTGVTDTNGQLVVVVPKGECTVAVAANGFTATARTVTVEPETDGTDSCIIPMLRSGVEAVSGSLTATRMTYEEIVEAGIDVTDPANNHVVKNEFKLQFQATPELAFEIPVVTMTNGSGDVVRPGKQTTWYTFEVDVEDEPNTGESAEYVPAPVSVKVGVFPITEYFYLVIYGETHWLKEMFNVELVVINNSYVEDIKNCTASLVLPEGMSLAAMVDWTQTLDVKLPPINRVDAETNTTDSSSHTWYVRGDKQGEYNLTAVVSGDFVSDESGTVPFQKEFTTTEPVKVYAGEALKLFITAQDTAYYNTEYYVKFELKNVSDIPLYNLSFGLTGAEQFRATVWSDGSETVEEVYSEEDFKDNMTYSIPTLQPGGSITIKFCTKTLFISEELEILADKISFIDIAYKLRGVVVTTLEGSTTEIPYELKLEPVEKDSFAEWLWDEVKDNAADSVEEGVLQVVDAYFFGGIPVSQNVVKVFKFASDAYEHSQLTADSYAVISVQNGAYFAPPDKIVQGASAYALSTTAEEMTVTNGVAVYADGKYEFSEDGTELYLYDGAKLYVERTGATVDGNGNEVDPQILVTTHYVDVDGVVQKFTQTLTEGKDESYLAATEPVSAQEVYLSTPTGSSVEAVDNDGTTEYTMEIPAAGYEEVVAFPYVLWTGEAMVTQADNVTWQLTDAQGNVPGGMSLDRGVLTVSSAAKAGTYTVTLSVPAAETPVMLLSEGTEDTETNQTPVYTMSQKITLTEAVLFKLYGANMDLGNALDMNFYVLRTDVTDEGSYAVITKNYADAESVTLTVPYADWTVQSKDLFKLTFTGIAAKEMADAITVVIYDSEGNQISEVWNDSVRAYCMRMLNKGATGTNAALYVDMLNYGAAAQKYFEYNESDLANNQLTDEQKALATTVDSLSNNSAFDSAYYYGANMDLESNINFNMYFLRSKVTSDMKAVISFTNHTGEAHTVTVPGSEFVEQSADLYKIVIDELVVADAKQIITCVIYDSNDNVVTTVTESIESYLARRSSTNELYEAIMVFSVSAYAYLHAND